MCFIKKGAIHHADTCHGTRLRPAMSVRLRKSAGEIDSPDGDGPQATEYSVEIEPYNRKGLWTNA